ncbi:MAG: hypothetical protein ABIJ40_14855, partial [Bacteroidota bacterium]
MSDNVFTISSAPTITVTSPNGGENWQVGTTRNITWTSYGVTYVAILYTTNNGTSWLTISSSTQASLGSFSWTVPNTPSSQCKVWIYDLSNAIISDVSDNFFTISTSTSKSITVISPNGGEKWNVGTTQQVRWSSSGVSTVRIEYSTNSGSTWILVVSSVSASTGSYNWTIPNTPS